MSGIILPDSVARPRASRPLEVGTIHLPNGKTHTVTSGDCPPIPGFLAHLDTYAGRAVPFVQDREPLTGPHWESLDAARVIYCLDEEACGMCGLPLDYRKTLLVRAPDEATARKKRGSRVPLMHERCARYAVAACPWIAAQPAAWWLYHTRSYTREVYDGVPCAVAAAPTRLERLGVP